MLCAKFAVVIITVAFTEIAASIWLFATDFRQSVQCGLCTLAHSKILWTKTLFDDTKPRSVWTDVPLKYSLNDLIAAGTAY